MARTSGPAFHGRAFAGAPHAARNTGSPCWAHQSNQGLSRFETRKANAAIGLGPYRVPEAHEVEPKNEAPRSAAHQVGKVEVGALAASKSRMVKVGEQVGQ
jgi:hypothetical protein